MRVFYIDIADQGKATVELLQVKTLGKTDRPKYSKRGRYLYTEVTYHFSATYNPATTSARVIGQEVVVKEGVNPFTTEVALRHFLSQPRKKLVIEDDEGNTILETPRDGSRSDAANGPLPTVMMIKEVVGGSTILVEWQVTIHLNEINKFGDEPVFLDHSWTSQHSIDENYFTTRVIEGRVIFNGAWLQRNNFVADDFRQFVLPEPPRGYKRLDINVVAEESGLELVYRVVDKELRCSLKKAGITKIDCIETVTAKMPSRSDALVNAGTLVVTTAGNVFDAIVNFIPGFSGGEGARDSGSGGGSGGGIGGTVSSFTTGTVSYIKGNMPLLIKNIYTRVQGSSVTPISTIRDSAYQICRHRLGSIPQRPILVNQEIMEKQDVVNGIVELSVTWISGIGQQSIQFAAEIANLTQPGLAFGAAPQVTGLIPSNNNPHPDICEWAFVDPVANASTAPRDGGTRGNSLASIFAQELNNTATVQPSRHNANNRNRLTPNDPQS